MLLLLLIIKMSWKWFLPLESISEVNCILGWKEFKRWSTWLIDPSLTIVKVSSTWRFQKSKWLFNLRTIAFSSSTMINPARTVRKGDPIATPSLCWYISLSKTQTSFSILVVISCLLWNLFRIYQLSSLRIHL